MIRRARFSGLPSPLARSRAIPSSRQLGISTVKLARRLLPAQITVTRSVQRGEKNVAEKQLLMSVDVD